MESSGKVGARGQASCFNSGFFLWGPVARCVDRVRSSYTSAELHYLANGLGSLAKSSPARLVILDLGCHSQKPQLIRIHWQ